MRISDWSSDVCSSDLRLFQPDIPILRCNIHPVCRFEFPAPTLFGYPQNDVGAFGPETLDIALELAILIVQRSEEHTSELQLLMRISYTDSCLTKHNNIFCTCMQSSYLIKITQQPKQPYI